ncbi:hypothetical protein G4Y79_04400 [Phototrophicus methaneseepsis]|uniref:Uncharacterized protein n=1 Tax=Phototrophicus methaneseepsis TaxID=2710758 RepID=A0A7S8EB00_9CHLR|nr:hypothetical protein [Phototrophicus methaneseepsis]QPC83630.1 hypothetical protein G4Y79_04400 [Phototrophicus methaneseepsis]
MKKRWYGRPNKPPENWHTPDKPAIRIISTWREEDSPVPSPPMGKKAHLVKVTLCVDDWVMILKTLQLYDAVIQEGENQNAQWSAWRVTVRQQILGTVNPHIDHSQRDVEVALHLEDWRQIWQVAHIICEGRGDDWQHWFARIDHTMTEQIKDQV